METNRRRALKSSPRVLWSHSGHEVIDQYEARLAQNTPTDLTALLHGVNAAERLPLLYGMAARHVAWKRQQDQTVDLGEFIACAPANRELFASLLMTDDDVAHFLAGCGYQSLGRIATGRTGGVYRTQRANNGPIAVATWIPAPFINQTSVDDPQASIDLSYMLHPHLARPTELTEFDDHLFLFNQWIAGPTFRQLAEQNTSLPVGAVCELVRQAAEGVGWLHRHGQIHGTLTLSSLLVDTQGEHEPIVKVSGFGLAHFARMDLLAFAPDLGSPAELSWQRLTAPECHANLTLCTPRSDVYTLGVTLIALLLGRIPGRLALRFQDRPIEQDSRPPLSAAENDLIQTILQPLGKTIPDSLVSIIRRAVSLLPGQRFPDGDSFAESLTEFADAKEFASLAQTLSSPAVFDSATTLKEMKTRSAAVPTEFGADSTLPIVQQSSDKPPVFPAENAQVPSLEIANPADSTVGVTKAANTRNPTNGTAEPSTEAQPRPSFTDLTGRSAARALSRRWRTRRMMVAAGMVLLLCGGVAWWWQTRADRQALPKIAIEVLERPGTTHEWWFAAAPWFTPQVRAEFARRAVDDADAHIRLATVFGPRSTSLRREDFESLKAWVQTWTTESQLADASVTRQLLELNVTNRSTAQLKRDYQELAGQLADATTSASLHLRGVLHHAAGQFAEASGDYQAALDRYREDDNFHLAALCAADYSRLLIEYRQYSLANLTLRDHVLASAESQPLRFLAYCMQAEVYRKWDGQFRKAEAALAKAELVLGRPSVGSAKSLSAKILEAQGWNAFDQWNLPVAHRHFTAALALQQTARDEGDQEVWQAMIWSRQGLAMVDHFVGRQDEAIQTYQQVLSSIETILSADAVGAVSSLSRPQREQLSARRPNLCERLGDSHLFGPREDPRSAARWYHTAIEYANHPEFDLNAKWPYILAVRYKRCVALLRHGDENTARQCWEHAEEELKRHERQAASQVDAAEATAAAQAHRRILHGPRSLSELMLQLYQPESDRRGILRALEAELQQLSLTRRTLDVYLLGSQVIVESLDAPPEQVLRVVSRIAANVERFLNKSSGDEELRYFQRYAEFAVRAGSIAQARLNRDKENDSELKELEAIATRGASLEEPFEVSQRADDDHQIHTLAIGVSNYKNHTSNQPLNLPYAAGDARAMDQAFELLVRTEKQAEPSDRDVGVFQAGVSVCLTDADATRQSIFAFFDELKRRRGADLQQDLVFVSIAGHGVLDDLGYLYFLPHDYRPGQLLSSAIDVDQIKKQLSLLRCNAVLLLDTCHSGAALRSADGPQVAFRSAGTTEVSRALKKFADSGRGVIVFAASRAQERAAEGDPFAGHGALTAAALEFLRQKQFDIATKGNLRPVSLHIASQNQFITLEGFRRYIQDRLGQFQHLQQSPLVRVVSGYDVGNYDPAKIPLRRIVR